MLVTEKVLARPQNNRPWPEKSQERITLISKERAAVQASFRRISRMIVRHLPHAMQTSVGLLYTIDHTARSARRVHTRKKNSEEAVPVGSSADLARRKRDSEHEAQLKELDLALSLEWQDAMAKFETTVGPAIELAVAALDKSNKDWIASDEIWLLSYYAKEPMTVFHTPFMTQKLAFRAIHDNPNSILNKYLAEDENLKEHKKIERTAPPPNPNAKRDKKLCAFCQNPTATGLNADGVAFCSTTCSENFKHRLLKQSIDMAKAYFLR